MRVITSVAAMQRASLKWRRKGLRVGLVPTMGYLHAGHLSLVKKARRGTGPRGIVVVSIFVNPTQFGPGEDLARYPRDPERDKKLCRAAGVDVLFMPADKDVYSEGHSTYVVEEKLSQTMEGASRPAHFRGVTTIVAKLFNIVLPELAVFGAKDFQQAAVVRRMARDLNFPVRIIVAPTVRERDGLAMSSRNKYLEGDLRAQAGSLFQAMAFARAAVKNRRSNAAQLRDDLRAFIEKQPDARVDYIEFFDPATLEKASELKRDTHMALAVFIGTTRLIDNGPLGGQA